MRCLPQITESFSSVHESGSIPVAGRGKQLELSGKTFRRHLRGAPRDERAGAAIGAGIVAAIGGVGLLEVDLIDRSRQRGRGDLAMHRGWCRCRTPRCRRSGRSRRRRAAQSVQSAIWPSGGTVSIMVSAMPSPVSQSSDKSGFGALRSHRALDQIEALVEAVAAVVHVGVRRIDGRQHRIAASPCCGGASRRG